MNIKEILEKITKFFNRIFKKEEILALPEETVFNFREEFKKQNPKEKSPEDLRIDKVMSMEQTRNRQLLRVWNFTNKKENFRNQYITPQTIKENFEKKYYINGEDEISDLYLDNLDYEIIERLYYITANTADEEVKKLRKVSEDENILGKYINSTKDAAIEEAKRNKDEENIVKYIDITAQGYKLIKELQELPVFIH